MPTERFDFDSGEHRLAGRLETPVTPPTAYALFAHCFTCSKDIAAASRISRALVAEGIAVLRFDFTGLGNSDGDFANTNFSSNVDDLVAAAAALEAAYAAPQLLVGHSLGGAAVLAAAEHLPSVKAVVTIGAPADPAHVKHLFAGELDDITRDGRAEVTLAGRRFTIEKQFVEDLEEQRTSERVHRLRRALLILHAPLDELVSIDEARKIYTSAMHPKSFIALDGADHLLSRPRDSQYVGRAIAAWASRYLPAPPEDEAMPHGEVRVQSVGHLTQAVTMGHHHLLADEPESVGGADLGGSPYDLLLAGLGACTSMTLQMYARRKEWPLERVAVDLKHERMHAKDCEECEQKEGRIERITRSIRLEGPLDDAQRQRLLEIANRCPVHRTLENKPHITTRFAD